MAQNISSTEIYFKDGHSNEIVGVMNQMRKDVLLCDVILVTAEVERPAHKTVLAASSSYFYNIFTDSGDCQQNRLILNDVSAEALSSVLEFIYTSRVKITNENVQVILIAANLLQLNDLRDFCRQFLKNRLTSKNCLEIRANVNLRDFEDLIKDAEDFLLENFTDVAKSQAFLQLAHEEVSEIILNDQLTVPSEAEVFESVLTWTKHDLELRQQHFVSLMKTVRIYWLPKKYINDTFLEEPLLKDDPQCQGFIIEAFKCLIPDKHAKMTTAKPRKYLSKENITSCEGSSKSKILLVAGGSSSPKSVEYYCFEKKAWSKLTDMFIDRNAAGLTVLDEKVYIVGGSNENRVDIYDAVTDKWIPSNGMLSKRQYFGVATLKNCIYAVGGYSSDRQWLDTVEKYNPETKKWSAVAPMLSKRHYHGVGVINDILYAVGGHDGSTSLNSVECYNPTTNTWTYVKSMNSKRHFVGVGVLNGMLYAVGGRDESNSVLKSAEVFDPKTGNWTKIKDMHNCRCAAAVIAANDLLYVVGGYDGLKVLTSIEVYDPKTMTWSMLPSCMNVGRYYHCAAILDKST